METLAGGQGALKMCVPQRLLGSDLPVLEVRNQGSGGQHFVPWFLEWPDHVLLAGVSSEDCGSLLGLCPKLVLRVRGRWNLRTSFSQMFVNTVSISSDCHHL